MMPFQLRQYFAWYLINDCSPSATKIYEKFKTSLSEDFTEHKELRALRHINSILKLENLSLSHFGLPTIGELEQELDDFEENNNNNCNYKIII